MTANADQITYWNETVGGRWVENQVKLDRLMRPLTDALMEVAAPAKGEFVLDVGCGCGDLEPRLAAAVGTSGRVRGIDISKPMLARAKTRVDALDVAHIAPIELIEADAMTFAFQPNDDLLISRFGVMFFEDRLRAFKNLRSALKPGGRFAVLAWRGRDEIEWFRKPLEWVSPVLGMPDSADGEIGPCALADGEATRLQLEEAGFWDVRPDPIDRVLTIGSSVDEAFAMLVDTGPAARLIRDAGPDEKPRAETLLREGLEKQAEAGPVEMRGACWIFHGTAG